MSFEWTPKHVSALMALWAEGVPASEIGRRLGVTKNAIVGKVHRLGLTKRQSPIRPKAAPEPEVVKLERLTADMCSWPEGEPGTPEFTFCGKPSVPDKPYCAAHCARAYVKSTRDRRPTRAA